MATVIVQLLRDGIDLKELLAQEWLLHVLLVEGVALTEPAGCLMGLIHQLPMVRLQDVCALAGVEIVAIIQFLPSK